MTRLECRKTAEFPRRGYSPGTVRARAAEPTRWLECLHAIRVAILPADRWSAARGGCGDVSKSAGAVCRLLQGDLTIQTRAMHGHGQAGGGLGK